MPSVRRADPARAVHEPVELQLSSLPAAAPAHPLGMLSSVPPAGRSAGERHGNPPVGRARSVLARRHQSGQQGAQQVSWAAGSCSISSRSARLAQPGSRGRDAPHWPSARRAASDGPRGQLIAQYVWNTDGPDTFDCSGPVHYAMSAPASIERIAARLVLFGTLAAYAGSRAARCHQVAWGLARVRGRGVRLPCWACRRALGGAGGRSD